MDPWVENNDFAAVGAAADQTTETLLEFDDGLGQLVILKRLAAGGADFFEPCFEQWPVGYAERELRDDDRL